MASKIYRSPFPDLDLPKTDFVRFIFSNPFNVSEDSRIWIDPESDRSRTFRDVVWRTKCLASGFQKLGIKEDDVVALFSPNTIDYGTICFAAIGCGGIASLMNAALTATEVKAQLETSGAKCVVVHHSLLDIAQEATRGTSVHIIGHTDGKDVLETLITVEQLITDSPPMELVHVHPSKLADKTAFMCFSSGTTGPAKGVLTTHQNICFNQLQWKEQQWKTEPPGSTFVAFLPFCHIYGVAAHLCMPMIRGTTVVVMPKFDLQKYLGNIQKYRARYLQVVPPIALLLAKDPTVSQYDLSSVKRINSAAAYLSFELATTIEDRFKQLFGTTITINQCWGLTETSPVATATPGDGSTKKPGVGFISPNMEFRLVDPETLMDVGLDSSGSGKSELGEMWVRGPNVTKGYYRNDEANQRAIHIDEEGQKWFRTGDIATIDKDGWLEMQDRIKDMIKYKGSQVIPSELEAKLLESPEVEDCCVVGRWEESMATELPVAFVVPRNKSKKAGDQEIIVENVHAWLNDRVAPYKRLRGGVVLMDKILKSPSGKILKKDMKLLLEKGSPLRAKI